MEPYGNDLQNHIRESDSRAFKGKCVAEDLSYLDRREAAAQPLNLQTEAHISSRCGYNLEIYCQRWANTVENTILEPKIRKKNPTYCFLEPLSNFPQEDSGEIIKDRCKWKKYQQVSTDGPYFPSFSYKCTYPGCTMRMHTERVSLHPDKMMVSYEGVHNHGEIQASTGQLPPAQISSYKPFNSRDLQQYPCISVSEHRKLASQYDVMHRLQSPSVYIMKLDQYIEHLKPNYGIFLNHPSKIKYGVLDDRAAESTASISGMSSSQVGFGESHQAFCAVHNVFHSPLYCNSIPNPYHSQQLQQVYTAEYHSVPFPDLFFSSEPSVSLGIQCANTVMAGGEINFHYNLMQRTFKPLTYEDPSSSLMAGGVYRNTGVINGADELCWIHPSCPQLNGNLTENFNA
ncbi:uncharacterized protein LOC110023051 isoform X2 [Phalaenopsis equestris]|nr:uncharacterized protein LOC110023051 isoform X2 [Phalaenopsis equestris]